MGTHQITLGAKPDRNGLSVQLAPCASKLALSQSAAMRMPLENEWRETISDCGCSPVR